jgi:hypothetical protein
MTNGEKQMTNVFIELNLIIGGVSELITYSYSLEENNYLSAQC